MRIETKTKDLCEITEIFHENDNILELRSIAQKYINKHFQDKHGFTFKLKESDNVAESIKITKTVEVYYRIVAQYNYPNYITIHVFHDSNRNKNTPIDFEHFYIFKSEPKNA